MINYLKLLFNNPESVDNTFQESKLNVIQWGQSLSVGEYGLNVAGFSTAKMNQSNARYLDTRGFINGGLISPTWKQFGEEYMDPYIGQAFTGLPPFGVAGQYTIAELLKTNHNIDLDFYMAGRGNQWFGSDANPGNFHISADGLTVGNLTADFLRALQHMKNQGYTFHVMNIMHGESDALNDPSFLSVFDVILLRLMTAVRNIYPDILFFVRIMPEEARAWIERGTVGGLDIINAKIMTAIETIGNAHPVLMSNPHSLENRVPAIHESVPIGSTQLGESLYNKYNEILNFN